MSEYPLSSNEKLDQLIDCLRYRPGAVIAAQMREAAETLERLRAVAVAARALSDDAGYVPDSNMSIQISEAKLLALENELEAAGYGMSEEELEARLESEREPPEEDGECYRGGEAAAALAEEQAWIQRNLK